jgi:hypothetical protein
MLRVFAIAAVLVGAAGCASEPARPAPAKPLERAAPAAETRTAAPVEGSGTALDEAPPQRRFHVVMVGGNGPGARMKLVEEPNATALPANAPVEPKIPEPPPVEKPPEREAPPPVIKIPAPR